MLGMSFSSEQVSRSIGKSMILPISYFTLNILGWHGASKPPSRTRSSSHALPGLSTHAPSPAELLAPEIRRPSNVSRHAH